MSQAEVYQLCEKIRDYMPCLGYWQALTLALYCYGVMVAEKCLPSKVAEKCGAFGTIPTVQRRLERWLANDRIRWTVCCRAWCRWVLSRYSGEQIILLVDETKIGVYLSAMVVVLAYRGCSIPLVYWCYAPDAYPDGGQVALISTLLSWVLEAVPDSCTPILQADRGIGTSPELIRAVVALNWQVLFRIQRHTRILYRGQVQSLAHVVNGPGQHWTASAKVFKKAGWLDLTVHVIWEVGYAESWVLITNASDDRTQHGWLYARRYWQEAAFRDLKSDGWHWQQARIFTPDHANRLLLVLCLASAWTLTLGTFAFDDPEVSAQLTKPSDKPLSLFRLGVRAFNFLRTTLSDEFSRPIPYLLFSDPPPFFITVGA